MSSKRRKVSHDPAAEQESPIATAPKMKKIKTQPEEKAASPPPTAASEDESATVADVATKEAAPVSFKDLVRSSLPSYALGL